MAKESKLLGKQIYVGDEIVQIKNCGKIDGKIYSSHANGYDVKNSKV